jgi:isopentenyl-diphosphate delta-isomerase
MLEQESPLLHVVNNEDHVEGLATREECHTRHGKEGLWLHRATTVLVTDSQGRLLITKRSLKKDLWPDYWDTTASSHPSEYESYLDSAKRSLKNELGIEIHLEQIGKFTYEADFDETRGEHEKCALFIGLFSGKLLPNPEEISKFKWIYPKDLQKEIDSSSDISPWLIEAFKAYLDYQKK